MMTDKDGLEDVKRDIIEQIEVIEDLRKGGFIKDDKLWEIMEPLATWCVLVQGIKEGVDLTTDAKSG